MVEVIIISLIISCIAAIGLCVGVIKYYKRGVTSPIYPLEHYTRLNLRSREDRFLHRNVTRVRVQSSDKGNKR